MDLTPMYDELEAIARETRHPLFFALDKLAESKQRGAVVCMKCRCRIKGAVPDQCPKCGAQLDEQGNAEGLQKDEEGDSGDTGAEQAEREAGTNKYAGVRAAKGKKYRTTLYNAALHFKKGRPGKGNQGVLELAQSMKAKKAMSLRPKTLTETSAAFSQISKVPGTKPKIGIPSTVIDPVKAKTSLNVASRRTQSGLATVPGGVKAQGGLKGGMTRTAMAKVTPLTMGVLKKPPAPKLINPPSVPKPPTPKIEGGPGQLPTVKSQISKVPGVS